RAATDVVQGSLFTSIQALLIRTHLRNGSTRRLKQLSIENPALLGMPMCNLYSITTNQAAIIALFRVINRYVGNLPPMPGVYPDYPAPVVRNAADDRELTSRRWGMPPPPRAGGAPVTNI